MPELVWDKVGDRTFESGLDRGVLYLPGCVAVPWNGLTEVVENFDKETSPVYFDGMKISDLVVLGDFSATMKAVTYPDEFIEVEGLGRMREGLFLGDQPPKTFGLCYRTQVGNDFEGPVAGYKIHIIYNVTAIPSQKTMATISGDPNLTEFEWTLTAIPEEVPGFRPSAHVVVDTRTLDPYLIAQIEQMLYGNTYADACLLPMSDLVDLIDGWFRVKIIDNLDGTWTAITIYDGIIVYLDPVDTIFQILGVNAVYLNDYTYIVKDTIDASEIPQILIIDNGDGTWTASTDHDNLIVPIDATTVEIRNANTVPAGTDRYRISNTAETS